MGLRNSKKSVDIAASSGSPKKNGTEPTDVKVKDLAEDGQSQPQTELIEEVAAKVEASTKVEGHANGETPKKEDESPVGEDVAEADKENSKPLENGKEEMKPEEKEEKEKKDKVKKKRSFRSFSFLRREKKAAKCQETANGEVAKDDAKSEEPKHDEEKVEVATEKADVENSQTETPASPEPAKENGTVAEHLEQTSLESGACVVSKHEESERTCVIESSPLPEVTPVIEATSVPEVAPVVQVTSVPEVAPVVEAVSVHPSSKRPPSPKLHPSSKRPPSPKLHPSSKRPPSPKLHPSSKWPPFPKLHPSSKWPPSPKLHPPSILSSPQMHWKQLKRRPPLTPPLNLNRWTNLRPLRLLHLSCLPCPFLRFLPKQSLRLILSRKLQLKRSPHLFRKQSRRKLLSQKRSLRKQPRNLPRSRIGYTPDLRKPTL
ncbi:IgA FC receptor isoform X1 [Hyalella azteca]|uniref:IgA FC receptor isoform X1 n=1 Tax=Hyalella azteca TaxID=294128 RepID=A0A979FJV9_HYAAZ|nr:IgA FC receptor isoform X1 [Hyalella azteca]